MKRSFDTILTYIDKLPGLDNKTIVITGCTSGIGFALARIVIRKHGKLIMAVRNVQKAEKAKDDLLKIDSSAQIIIEKFDQSNLDSINEFVTKLKFRYADFSALVINAGVLDSDRGKNLSNGLPVISGTNLFGPAYLANEVQRIMDSSKSHKIIFQGSLVSRKCKFKDFDRDFLDSYRGNMSQYALSKLGLYNIFRHFTNNAKMNFYYGWCEPGISGTQIFRNYPPFFRGIVRGFLNGFFNSSLQAALPAAYLVCTNISNGECVIPGGIFAASGLPKKVKFNNKNIYYSLPCKILDTVYGK